MAVVASEVDEGDLVNPEDQELKEAVEAVTEAAGVALGWIIRFKLHRLTTTSFRRWVAVDEPRSHQRTASLTAWTVERGFISKLYIVCIHKMSLFTTNAKQSYWMT